MFEDIMALAKLAMERHKERETNALMAEIEAFHIQNAIDKALKNNDRVAFLQLTGGINHANQI